LLLQKKYFNGEGVPQDYKKAVYWYSKAAGPGNFNEQEYLDKLVTKRSVDNNA